MAGGWFTGRTVIEKLRVTTLLLGCPSLAITVITATPLLAACAGADPGEDDHLRPCIGGHRHISWRIQCRRIIDWIDGHCETAGEEAIFALPVIYRNRDHCRSESVRTWRKSQSPVGCGTGIVDAEAAQQTGIAIDRRNRQ